MYTVILHNRWALGDTVCLSALVRDLHKAYPNEYRLLMSGHFKSFWRYNPYCTVLTEPESGQRIELKYRAGINATKQGAKHHFLSWFHEDFFQQTGIRVPVTEPKGCLFLSTQEKERTFFPQPYWIVAPGWKLDMPVKHWPTERYQQVVDQLAASGIRCVQAGADFHNHKNPRLNNCDHAVGKTDDIRDLFSLIYHADGIICGITSFMHLAAVFDKPCVVIAGGRESEAWEGYVNSGYPESFGPACAPVKVEHRYLHVVGKLEGCGLHGCWKDKLVADHGVSPGRQSLCVRPVQDAIHISPECMHHIAVADVVSAVHSYGTVRHPVPAGIEPGAPPPQTAAPELDAYASLDHPNLGGKVTIFVLSFGEHLPLLRRCVDSIITSVPAQRMDLRIALNQPHESLIAYVAGLGSRVSKCYTDHGTRRKYQAMREMFWDTDHPITTPYLVWFDDDSHCTDTTWLQQLAATITTNHQQGYRLYGVTFFHDLMAYRRLGYRPEKWFKAASWWRDAWLYGNNTTPTPNGSRIPFVGGSFWALATETMRAGDVPDVRLVHNGDMCIGAQVHQLGGKIKDFGRGKTPVRWSDAPRRGFHSDFPWSQVP